MTIFLQQVIYKYPVELGSINQSYLPPRFAVFIPTHWDQGIQKLIRSLFIRAKLITTTDHDRRLIFFTQLSTVFRYLQSPKLLRYERMNMKIEYGRQYITSGLKFTENMLYVNLDLFSAQYPLLTLTQSTTISKYVAKLLKSASFTVPLDCDIEKSIEHCLQKRNFDTQATKAKRILHEMIKQYKNQEVMKYYIMQWIWNPKQLPFFS